MEHLRIRLISEPESQRLNVIFDGVDADFSVMIEGLLKNITGKEIKTEPVKGLEPAPDTTKNVVSPEVVKQASEPTVPETNKTTEPAATSTSTESEKIVAKTKTENSAKPSEKPTNKPIIFINLPYNNKDEAKRIAKEANKPLLYNKEVKKWYVNDEATKALLSEHNLLAE